MADPERPPSTADVSPGVVYGYMKRAMGKGQQDTVVPIVFLAPATSSHLYTTASTVGRMYEKSRARKPRRERGSSSPPVGWPAASARLAEDAEKLLRTTIDDFVSAGNNWGDVTYLLVTDLSLVLGPYPEALDRHLQERAEANDPATRMDHARQRLDALGIPSRSAGWPHTEVDLRLDIARVEELLHLLEKAHS